MAAHADAVAAWVAAVDDDLAPQHKYPVQVEQAYAALRWLAGNAAGLGVRADRISVGGTSFGGALAAAVALTARDLWAGRPVLPAARDPGDRLPGHCARCHQQVGQNEP